MTPRSTLKVKVIGEGHQVKKRDLRPYLTDVIAGNVSGHMGQGQRSGSPGKTPNHTSILKPSGLLCLAICSLCPYVRLYLDK